MDMSIVAINKTQMKVQWAGANNPLWVVRSHFDDQTEDKVQIIKPDRMPISIYLKMEPFVNNEFKIAQGDTLFLFSDGIYSQLGGKNGTKYNIKNFRNLLAKNSSLPLIQQREIIENEISDWMKQNNNIVQTDDITVLGFRV